MCTPSILHRSDAPPTRLPVPAATAGSLEDLRPTGRRRIWELAANFHCSVVGTCLTTGELRQLFAKLGDSDARTVSDHQLHGRGVRAAGTQDLAGKLLNKMLERRHETAIKRFAKARTAAELKALWAEALEKGEIPGSYWAVLTHPLATRDLSNEAFGEVHMLSHLVGMAARTDIVRLRQLERELEERNDKIARQEARLQRAGEERAELDRRLAGLEAALRQSEAERVLPREETAGEPAAGLAQKLERERARSARLAAELGERERRLAERELAAEALERRAEALEHELATLESSLEAEERPGFDSEPFDLADRTLLYVGGRPKQVEQLKALTARRGGMLLTHDGGVEDNALLLPGLISQADIAFFPVDCVSHLAAGQVKRLCREAMKPFVPLRSTGIASFMAAMATLPALSEPALDAG